MKKINLTVFSISLFCFSLVGQSLHYSIDEAHSQIKFIGLLGSMMEVEGKFDNFWGDVFFDPDIPEKLSVTVVINPASLDSDNEWRDKHLKNPEFLDVEKYDVILFKSIQVEKVNESLNGSLLLKGEEKSITINYKNEFGPGDDPWQNKRLTFSGSFTFSRSEYGMGPIEGFWGKSIADEAKIEFTISTTRQNMERMSMLKQEKIAAIWEKLTSDDMDGALAALDDLKNNPEQEEKGLNPRVVDLLAKRLRQYGHQKEYLHLLQKNAEYFPETHWVYSNLALGLWENGKKKEAEKIAQKALEMNPQNSLAIELLK